MPFKRIPIVKLDKESVDRNLQKIEVWSEEIERTEQVPVKVLTSSVENNSYTVTPSDFYLAVDPRGGPMKIVFPAVKSNQVVNVLRAYQGAAVSLVQSNGNAFLNAPATITLEYNESAKMVSDGRGWFRWTR